jgi:hypothetical protein
MIYDVNNYLEILVLVEIFSSVNRKNFIKKEILVEKLFATFDKKLSLVNDIIFKKCILSKVNKETRRTLTGGRYA